MGLMVGRSSAASGWEGLLGRGEDGHRGKRLKELIEMAPEARFWISSEAEAKACAACHQESQLLSPYQHAQAPVKCVLCAQECVIPVGERGVCRTRINIGGRLRSLSYGHPITTHVDPIEKKPFYHFMPGSAAFSMATAGCPLSCQFCQNWEISQSSPEDFSGPFIPAERLVRQAADGSVPIIAFTYNEPSVFAEYLIDIAQSSRKRGIKNVLVSCGIMNPKPLAEFCDVLDAIKIDLKGFSEAFYSKVCGASLAPVLRSIKTVAQRGVHLELVNLVVPTLNDSESALRGLVTWVAGELGPDVPVHFTRFHPDYKLRNLPPTPVATLERARALALEAGIHYPYVGNVPGHPGNQTYCPNCGKVVISRRGFFVVHNDVVDGKCRFCGQAIAGVF